MFLVGILSWWYSDGIIGRIRMIKNRLKVSADFFSIGLLIETLFAPFRQISAGSVGGSISNQIRAFFDKLLSRIIGSIVRSSMIIAGLVVMLAQILFGIFVIVFWLITPLLPVAGLIMIVIGWVPIWTK